MNQQMEMILRDLNSISRIAVLEEAFQTEKMICNYSKLLKYKWSHEKKVVTASMELEMIRLLFEFYQFKWDKRFSYQMNTKTDTKSIFIPHYTLLSYTTTILELIEKTSQKNMHIQVDVAKVTNSLSITIQFIGEELFELLMDSIQKDNSISYESIPASNKRWIDAFGDSTLRLEVKNNKFINLTFTAYDNYNGI